MVVGENDTLVGRVNSKAKKSESSNPFPPPEEEFGKRLFFFPKNVTSTVKKYFLYLGQSICTFSDLKHTQHTHTYELLVQVYHNDGYECVQRLNNQRSLEANWRRVYVRGKNY